MYLTAKRFKELAEKAGYQVGRYSGRMMFGKECASIVTDNPLVVGVEMANACREMDEVEELFNTFAGARQDAMGLSTVVYFPAITGDAILEDEDEDEDDFETDEEFEEDDFEDDDLDDD